MLTDGEGQLNTLNWSNQPKPGGPQSRAFFCAVCALSIANRNLLK